GKNRTTILLVRDGSGGRMKKDQGREEARGVDDLIGEMGRERVALRAKRATVILLLASSVVCLLSAAGSLGGFLPYAVGPSVVMIGASAVGFVLAYTESRGS
ncbi:MAG: hypothetical protein WA990_12860, partial [Rubrobacteraceae bacterium]